MAKAKTGRKTGKKLAAEPVKSTTAESRRPKNAPNPASDVSSKSLPVPAWLVRSQVYKRVPASVRARLDEVLLFRPKQLETLGAISEKFRLSDKYGVSPSGLRNYARKLEEYMRPAVTAQVLAAAMGCLPRTYRQRIIDGSQVLLLGRLVQSLDAGRESVLPIADLAKLASALSSLARRFAEAKSTRRGTRSSRESSPDADDSSDVIQPQKLEETIRTLYGLP